MTMAISASRPPDVLLRFDRSQWRDLIAELGLRGHGRRESGAFLLTDRDGDRCTVERTVYFDDLDPRCLGGWIRFNGLAYSELWDICEGEQLTVVGDVHTHPGTRVQQSRIDKANPMIARAGHVALVVPHFAARPVSPHQVGVHLYLGVQGWTSWVGDEAVKRLQVERWT